MSRNFYDRPARTNRRIAIPALAAALLLVGAGFFSPFVPSLVFHSRDPDRYQFFRDAAPFLLALAIVAVNVFIWSLIGPRLVRLRKRENRAPLIAIVALGLLIVSALVAGVFYYILVVISLTTIDWSFF